MVAGCVVPDRHVEPSNLGSAPANVTEAKVPGYWKGKRSNLEFQDLEEIFKLSNGKSGVLKFVESKIKKPLEISRGPALLRPFGYLGTIGELLFIFRPVIYILLLQKLGKKSWKPWIVSLIIEISSRKLISADFESKETQIKTNSTGMFSWNRTLEAEEQSRRLTLFVYYLLRSPMLDKYIEERMNGFVKWSSTKPIFNMFGSLVQDYIPLWKEYYFYTSSS
ncbi:hypothetical protein BB559_005485 [Furculomyces boomerangus]|uniref:Peroxisomal membrane protein PEX16 n=3 Tax=Harpellales TaxID=61421 RepID=A0A2T9Y8G6_9FUNG|nr:hypothetical protein BB559_005485 [Furculomyces boomerangus]PWA00091.1 hypothetical protein BB558_003942 [Smittium angustum]